MIQIAVKMKRLTSMNKIVHIDEESEVVRLTYYLKLRIVEYTHNQFFSNYK